MKNILKIFIYIYYVLLAVGLIAQLLMTTANYDVYTLNPKLFLAFNFFFFISGVLSIKTKHKKWISKKLLLWLMIVYSFWIIISYSFYYHPEQNNYQFFIFMVLAMTPCLFHNFWYYLHFEVYTYSFSKLGKNKSIKFSDIINLDLPYLEVVNKTDSNLELILSKHIKGINIFISLAWFILWVFISYKLITKFPKEFINSLNTEFVFFILVFIMFYVLMIYVFIKNVFYKVKLKIDKTGVLIEEYPFFKQVHFSNFSDVEVIKYKGSSGGKGGRIDIYLRVNKNGKNIDIGRNVDNEIIYVIIKLIEAKYNLKFKNDYSLLFMEL